MFDLLPINVISTICKKICIYDYYNIHKYLLINKLFKEYLSTWTQYLNNLQNKSVLMATQIKYFRPESEQIDTIINNFILFDNKIALQHWKNNSKEFQNRLYGYQNNIVICKLFKTYGYNKKYNNFIIEPQKIIKNTTENIFNKIQNILINQKINCELNVEEYFIYYYLTDYVYCYGIAYKILPYYDYNLTKDSRYIHINKIKKNILSHHKIDIDELLLL